MDKIKYLLQATRPKTLPASVVPVLIGSSISWIEKTFYWPVFILIIICALFIQIISNYFNEVYDYYKGADSKGRVGPQRVVSAGLVSVNLMKNTAIGLVIITFLIGLVLVFYAGYPILIAGVVSLLFAYAYTGGPLPLAYMGLGDIFVFIFFGLVATMGSYFVFSQKITLISFLYALPPGFISSNILGVNNLRDMETDSLVGKKTFAVRFGKNLARYLYITLSVLSYIIPLILFFITGAAIKLLPLISIPYAFILCHNLYTKSGKELNAVLAGTGKLLLLYGVLAAISNYPIN